MARQRTAPVGPIPELLRTRVGAIIAYLTVIPVLVGTFAILAASGADDYAIGAFWIALGALIAGAAIGARRPLRGATADPSRISRSLVRDLLVVLSEWTVAIVAVVVVSRASGDNIWQLLFFAVVGEAIGFCLGVTIVVIVLDAARDARAGNGIRVAAVWGVVFLTILVIWATVTATAAEYDNRFQPVVESVMSGIPFGGVTDIDPVKAWWSRGLFVMMLAAAAGLGHAGHRYWRGRRPRRGEGPGPQPPPHSAP